MFPSLKGGLFEYVLQFRTSKRVIHAWIFIDIYLSDGLNFQTPWFCTYSKWFESFFKRILSWSCRMLAAIPWRFPILKVHSISHGLPWRCGLKHTFWAHLCIFARWAHMRRFLSVCLSIRLSVTLLKFHISESIIDRGLKLYHSVALSQLWLTTLSEKNHVSKWLWYYCCDR